MKIRNLLTTLVFASCTAQALPLTQMTITDTDGDGLAGCFRFGFLNADTCAGATQFSSDGSVIGNPDPTAATIPGASNDGAILFGQTQDVDDFTRGFMFTNFPMKPVTLAPPSGEIKSKKMFIDKLEFAVLYISNAPHVLPMSPDAGTLEVEITEKNSDNTYNYIMTWSHFITSEDDPTDAFVGFTAFWRLEGVASTCASQTGKNDFMPGDSLPPDHSCAKPEILNPL